MHGLEETAKTQIRSYGIGQNEGIEPVIFCVGNREAVPEPIELLEIDGMSEENGIHQMLDDRPMWHFSTDGDTGGLPPPIHVASSVNPSPLCANARWPSF